MFTTGYVSGEKRKKWVGYGSMSLPVDSSHKAALPSLPLESTYCDREINEYYLHSIAVQHYWSERGKREEGRRQLSYL